MALMSLLSPDAGQGIYDRGDTDTFWEWGQARGKTQTEREFTPVSCKASNPNDLGADVDLTAAGIPLNRLAYENLQNLNNSSDLPTCP